MSSAEVNHPPEQVIDEALEALARWPAERLTQEELERLAETGEIESVIVATPDIPGKLYGKSMPVRLFLAGGHMEFSSAALTYDNDWNVLEGRFPDVGYVNGWADMRMHPDMRSLRRLATFDRTAIVLADGTWADGEPVQQLPRGVLKRQLDRATERGLGIVCAVETEFYIFAEDYPSARAKNYHGLERVNDAHGDYSIFHMSLVDPLLTEIRQACIASGIPVEAIKHEWGRVQLELTLTYCDAMEAADRITLFKMITKQIALRHGMVATFMARWSHEEGASSGHIHGSVWDLETRKSLMADESDPAALGTVGRQWLGGLMAVATDLMPLSCPNVNSYKRLDPEAFAPVTNAWSLDVRTVPFRLVGNGPSLHIENRIPGADANFYLALAGMIAAGLYGIENDLEPIGEPVTTAEAPGEPLPRNLPDAIKRFRNSERAREVLGDELVDHLVAFSEHELEVYEKQVSDIERRRSFESA